jgi:hypothetical protein
MNRSISVGVVWMWLSVAGAEPGPAFFDAHIHYNANSWAQLEARAALARLDAAGIERALVSSTPSEGTERLYALAPERIVPLLRPYREPADRSTWFADPAALEYVQERLDAFRYRGIGEFHVFGEDAAAPVIRDIITLARERRLPLHAHTDISGLTLILEQAGALPVIWAHAGFDVPVAQLEHLLARHPQLYLELSFRYGLTDRGVLVPEWRRLFEIYPARVLIGMDTYIPGRWEELEAIATTARAWLEQLPEPLARAIAYDNAARLFPAP